MTYRIQYNGIDVEAGTLDAAIEHAKSAIVGDVGPIATWTVEHDEVVNDWFVQGSPSGSAGTYTATVAGPEPVAPVPDARPPVGAAPGSWYLPAPAGGHDEQLLRHRVTGGTPTEVFGRATAWLAGTADALIVTDLGWHVRPDAAEPIELTVYYRPRPGSG